jgi:hypothetical protein
MDSKISYLGMIQNVISRMASNSFLLKGWTVTLVVGLLAFANIKEMDSKYAILALIPIIFFWILDGFFIQQERLFRKLYEYAAALENEKVDFSMDTKPFKKEVGSWLKAIFSKTHLLFYLPILLVTIIIVFFKQIISLF